MLHLILALAVVGFLVYLIITYIPMPAPIKQAIVVIVVVCMVIYVLNILGFVDIPIPRVR